MLRRPLDSCAIALSLAAIVAIIVNGLYLQPGPHPAPLLAARLSPIAFNEASGAIAMPTARPLAAEPQPQSQERVEGRADDPVRSRERLVEDIQRELARRGYYDGAVDGIHGAKTDAAIRDFEQASARKGTAEVNNALLTAIQRAPARHAAAPRQGGEPRADPIASLIAPPPAPPSRQLVAVQRALADSGYGPIRPTGLLDAPTRTAITQFERERRLPITGEMSARLVRELAAKTGRPLE
ncbi:MAG: peptidoglycan-binding protein [Proteobacteria bacterium]|nr:peptidoglycan-binding protein [Pseudomonadota bacterium]